MYDFNFLTKTEGIIVEHSVTDISEGVIDLNLSLSFPRCEEPERVTIEWSLPIRDMLSIWTPLGGFDRSPGKNWGMARSSSRLAVGAPVLACVDARGGNFITIGVSDAKTPLDVRCGIVEETAELLINVVFFTSHICPISEYSATVRIDSRKLPFTSTVSAIADWWEKDCGYKRAFVPEAAGLPMNSLWYSFHQALDSERILRECELSADFGLKTVIIDDGWQTDDNNRGYCYCGDWELATSKIPDMKALADGIHKLGMKLMLWYSVPFVGEYSKVYERFKDMALTYRSQPNTIVLDPRYPEVRGYLTGVYEKALLEWELDGFKLDFIDDFRIREDSKPFSEGMDIFFVEDAVEALFDEITSSLKKIKPDVLIEFRQCYMGPSILKYGNMVRVGDCPYDARANRRAIVDLRLTSGESAVHSDMIMWHYKDSVEGACLQILATLFGVPQISVLFENLPDEHKKALAFWMGFYMKHRATLSGELSVKNPEMCYTQVTATKGDESVTANYASVIVSLGESKKHYFVNSTYENTVAVNSDGAYFATVYNCVGEKQSELTVNKGMSSIEVPACGLVEFTAK